LSGRQTWACTSPIAEPQNSLTPLLEWVAKSQHSTYPDEVSVDPHRLGLSSKSESMRVVLKGSSFKSRYAYTVSGRKDLKIMKPSSLST